MKRSLRFFVFTLWLFLLPTLSAAVITIADLPTAGGTLDITEDSTLTIGAGEHAVLNGTIRVLGSSQFGIVHMGALFEIGAGAFNVFGGILQITNFSQITGGSLSFLDQFDQTSIMNNGSITLTMLSLVANGGYGDISLVNTGQIHLGSMVLDANYGGQINVTNPDPGVIQTGALSVDATGSSHGQPSAINIFGTIQLVPEPATSVTAGLGLTIAAIYSGRRKRRLGGPVRTR